MKAIPSFVFRGGWRLLFAALCPALLFGQGGATITGQVSNQATQSYLEGAVVQIAGTNRVTTTDREGRYELTGVSPGISMLVVSFTGLDTQQVQVTVSDSPRVVRD